LGRKVTASMNEIPHKSAIRLTDKNSGESVEHIAEFTDDEWRQLHEFLSHVADLQSTRFIAKGAGVQMSFNWSQGNAPSWSVQAPPDDEVFAFLHRLRPLILQKEPACFPKVRALLNRKLKDAPLHPSPRPPAARVPTNAVQSPLLNRRVTQTKRGGRCDSLAASPSAGTTA
jgi:hypothetical protein